MLCAVERNPFLCCCCWWRYTSSCSHAKRPHKYAGAAQTCTAVSMLVGMQKPLARQHKPPQCQEWAKCAAQLKMENCCSWNVRAAFIGRLLAQVFSTWKSWYNYLNVGILRLDKVRSHLLCVHAAVQLKTAYCCTRSEITRASALALIPSWSEGGFRHRFVVHAILDVYNKQHAYKRWMEQSSPSCAHQNAQYHRSWPSDVFICSPPQRGNDTNHWALSSSTSMWKEDISTAVYSLCKEFERELINFEQQFSSMCLYYFTYVS